MRKRNMIISIMLFVIGLCVLLYPTVSNYLNNLYHAEEVVAYEDSMSNMSVDVANEEWQKAVDYNNSLIGQPVKDPFVPGSGVALPQNYLDVLDVDGIMGYIDIPSINVKLPIYHSTSEEVLQKGVGHIEGTALPIGSDSSHSVLTGHTGLPTAKLFTDLVDLVEGDTFYIHVLNKELIYKVDQIKIIDPNDISDLVADKEKDYVTLLTCYPYGVNSHRLLVRGERVNYYSKLIPILKDTVSYWWYVALYVSLFILLIILLVYIIRKIRRRRAMKKAQRRPRVRDRGINTA